MSSAAWTAVRKDEQRAQLSAASKADETAVRRASMSAAYWVVPMAVGKAVR